MNNKIYDRIVNKIIQNHYSSIFQLDLKTTLITEYNPITKDEIETKNYNEWLNQVVSEIQYIGIKPFMEDMNLNKIISVLDKNINSYIVNYQIQKEKDIFYYQLVSIYSDDKQCIIITKQDITFYMKEHKDKMIELQKDSERFRFIIKHLCENFGEINVKTGETWMTTSNNWEVEKGNLKEQIAWFADNLIVPEQREAYINDFKLENFVASLKRNNGFYAPTYAALYPDGIRHLLIINALLNDPLNPGEQYIFGFVQDITQLKVQEEKNKQLIDVSRQLLEISQTESVTKLLNRSACEEMIGEYLESSDVSGIFLIIDIDYFKKFNDNYGHTVGDIVLKYISKSMRDIFRSSDILCRWGGDEFVIFMPDLNNESIVKKRIRQLQTKMKRHMYNGTLLPITLSIGGIIINKNISLEILFKEADKLLYEVKKQGRNNFIISKL